MKFDVLASWAEMLESTEPASGKIVGAVRNAHLFKMDGVYRSTMFTELGEREFAAATELFFLPFPSVAIEDDEGVVLFADTKDDQRGLVAPRAFVVLVPGRPEDPKIVLSGMLMGSAVRPDGGLKHALMLSPIYHGLISSGWKRILLSEHPDALAPCQKNAVDSIGVAIEQIRMTNTPSRFIVEIEPKDVKPSHLASGRILRSHDRPIYTLLRPGEIKKLFGHEDVPAAEDKAHPAPHARRRHLRTLHSDSFVNKKGQTVIVSSCWVGPSEHEDTKHKYRVLFDK